MAAFGKFAKEFQYLARVVGMVVGRTGGGLLAQAAQHAHGPMNGGVLGGE